MKVFHLIDNPYSANVNPYVGTLIDGIKSIANYVEFGFGFNAFWNQDLFGYDILHIHWPDIFTTKNTTQEDIDIFVNRVQMFKAHDKKLIVTCHNLRPHYCNQTCVEDVYDRVYRLADVMIHLGSYSLKLMEKEYPLAKHVLCYHHTYDSLYFQADRESSIRRLRLNPEKKYILCFGDFRDNEERKLVDEVARYFYKKNIEVLAPRYYQMVKRRNLLIWGCQWLNCRFKEFLIPGLHIYGWFVSNDLLPCFYGASEICLIQRKKILNSGNLPMGFYFGKVVVGPNVGNVGDILESTGNPTFSSDDNESLFDAVSLAFELQQGKKGESNSQYAREKFSTHAVCMKLYDIYKSTLDT